jgi:hypothetical protein
MFQDIDLPRTYGNAEQWNFSKIKTPYDIHFPTLIQIVYKRDKVYYFSNKNVISVIIKVQGKFVDWLTQCSNSQIKNYLVDNISNQDVEMYNQGRCQEGCVPFCISD